MSLWRQLTRGLRGLTHGAAADRDVVDEVDHYFEQATDALIARGLSPDEARRVARLELGSETSVAERVRGYGWEVLVETALADVRFAARRLVAEPGFAMVAVLTLALGIGATTAIFSAVNPVLFERLPYPGADRIAMIWETRRGLWHNDGTFATYRELVERSRLFQALAVSKPWQPAIIGGAEPERLEGQRVSGDYFRVLGIAPALGRDFQPADDLPNGPRVVILGDGLWQRRFGGDRSVVGRPVTLDGDPFVVIGVMPKGFENGLSPTTELWAPLQYGMALPEAWGHHLQTMGRLRRGVSMDQASDEVDALAHAVVKQHPEAFARSARFVVTSMHDEMIRGVRPALVAILGGVVLVLLIACVNVTNLLLARGVNRRGEFALRAALGAGRGRLVRQLLTESLLLAAAGGLVGTAVAVVGVRMLVALSPPGLPRLDAIRVDGTVFVFGLGVTTAIAIAFGLTPALQAARTDPHQDLQHGSRRTVGGHRRTRSALVIAEVALALVLLVSSGLLLRSLEKLFAVPSGFNASRLLTMQVQTSGHRFDDDQVIHRFFERSLDAVRHLPGVTAAAFTSQLPLSGDFDAYGAHFEAGPTEEAESYSVFRYAVSPGYFETIGIRLLQGRLLDEHDRQGAPLVAVISEALAKRRFHATSPLGQHVRIGPLDGPPYTIVGVVADVKQLSLTLTESDAVYTTATQWHFADPAMSLVVHAPADDVAAVAKEVRYAVWSVDRDQPVTRVATMDELVARSAAERRFALILFEAFALAALVLAAAGIYGVLSGSVAERTREIGVRSALGASRVAILALITRQGMTLAMVGAAIGLVGAFVASEAIVTLLFGVSRLDPTTYLAVMALLLLVAAVASLAPAWRAARIDPAITLRAE